MTDEERELEEIANALRVIQREARRVEALGLELLETGEPPIAPRVDRVASGIALAAFSVMRIVTASQPVPAAAYRSIGEPLVICDGDYILDDPYTVLSLPRIYYCWTVALDPCQGRALFDFYQVERRLLAFRNEPPVANAIQPLFRVGRVGWKYDTHNVTHSRPIAAKR